MRLVKDDPSENVLFDSCGLVKCWNKNNIIFNYNFYFLPLYFLCLPYIRLINVNFVYAVTIHTDQMKDVIRCLLETIQEQRREIFPDHAPTFNNLLKYKIRLMKQMLRIIHRFPNIPVMLLLYFVECKIEREKFILDISKFVDLTDELFDNVEKFEHI